MSQPSTVAALRSLAGDQAQDGWQALVEHHGPDVWRLILSRSRDTNDAEDAYQDFWMRLPRSAVSFRTVEGVDPERSARAWLMRVAYTTAIDRVRRRRPLNVALGTDASSGVTMDQTNPKLARLLVDSPERPGTGELQDREMLLLRVQSALNKLSENYRRPLLLYVVAGLSYEELAADLSCTVNNARVRVHRSLKRLREVLGGNEASLNERALASLIMPVLLTIPSAPPLASALSMGGAGIAVGGAAVGGATKGALGGVGVATKGALGGVGVATTSSTTMIPLAIGVTGVAAAGIAAVVLFAGTTPVKPIAAPPTPAANVRVLDDFNRSALNLEAHSFIANKLPELSLAPAPADNSDTAKSPGSGNALRMEWSAVHRNWIDCHYLDQRPPLVGVAVTATTIATMQVWAPQTTRVHHLAIRFADAVGEIFEWRQPLPEPGKTGWRTVEFQLDPAKAARWEKRPNVIRRVELPITLHGYAIDLTGEASKDGVVIIDDVHLRLP